MMITRMWSGCSHQRNLQSADRSDRILQCTGLHSIHDSFLVLEYCMQWLVRQATARETCTCVEVVA